MMQLLSFHFIVEILTTVPFVLTVSKLIVLIYEYLINRVMFINLAAIRYYFRKSTLENFVPVSE